jgi:Chemoreceptor zinc-binding domain
MMLKSMLYDAISEHVRCKECLRNAIDTGECNPPSVVIKDEKMCKFGQWLHDGDLPEEVKTSSHLENMQKIHVDFHHAAAEIMALIEGGDAETARQIIAEGGSYSVHANRLRSEILNWVQSLPDRSPTSSPE